MRRLAFLPFLLLLTPAAAQEPCSEADPCAIPLDMDEDNLTFGAAGEYSVTAGDWFVFDAFNTDDVAHDVAIADLGIGFTVQPLSESRHGPYLLDAPGDYTITDITTGRTAVLHVLWEDVATQTPPAKDTPALAPMMALVALLGLALLRRS